MSKKRTSTESSNDEQTNEDSDAVSRQQEDNAKRGKFVSFSDTTLQDIPTEILQCILIKAITMEVKNMKLAKRVWKEKADLVISRLGSVCSQWTSVLTTDFFQIELHKVLDGIAQEKFRMERVQELLEIEIDCSASIIVTLKDDIFLFCSRNDPDNTTSGISSVYNIRVYDRNNMAAVKDVIQLPGLRDGTIEACNVSNCVYVLKKGIETQCDSVLRITKDENQKFNIQPWISDLSWSVYYISVSDDGRVILVSKSDELGPHRICVYNPNGLLQHEVVLSQDVYGFERIDSCVMRKCNGNLLLASLTEQDNAQMQDSVDLTEIDTNGTIQRQYKSSLGPENGWIFMSVVDAFGSILVHDTKNEMELLDSELNLLEFTGPQSVDDDDVFFDGLHFDRERNEVMGICSIGVDLSLLRIFRFIEE